jgi:signal transduction histidine kinase
MEKGLLDPSTTEYFSIICNATRDIQTQIEFTRIYEELGSHEPQWILLDLVIPRSQVPSSVTLNTDIQGIIIFADPMLEKVFFNLLDNSLRHGETVSEIRVSARKEGDFLIVVWEDNGVGIADNEKEKIFERGFGKNTSLGMFLVREILSLTDIRITENGKPGTGARFEMKIPRESYRVILNNVT